MQCDYCHSEAVISKYRAWTIFPGIPIENHFCADHSSIIDEFDFDTLEEAIAVIATHKLQEKKNDP